MQPTIITRQTLEEFYMQVILPQFGIVGKNILWQEHTIIGPDNDMFLFLCDDEQMALVFDDYPTTTIQSLNSELDGRKLTQIERATGTVQADNDTDDRNVLRFGTATPFQYVHNITGYFQLFRLDTSIDDVRKMRLQSRRRALHADTKAYLSLLDMGFEMIALARDGVKLDRIQHLAGAAKDHADLGGFGDISYFFWDFAEIDTLIDVDGDSLDDHLLKLQGNLGKLADAAHINPDVTASEKSLLDTYITPIHTKMMQNPSDSPKYFIDMAHELARLIANESLSIPVAGSELSYTLDRPQIASDKHLKRAVELAYELELAGTHRTHDPAEQWKTFYEEIKRL